jgi:hypothetical protein
MLNPARLGHPGQLGYLARVANQRSCQGDLVELPSDDW